MAAAERHEGGAVRDSEIWSLIIKADDALKYATQDKTAVRKQQALRLLRQALDEAEAVGSSALAEQARMRLRDLGQGDE